MEHDEHIDAVESEVATIVAVLADGPSDADVPTCPDFDLDALGEHVGQVCGFWFHVLCDATGATKVELGPCEGAADRADWLSIRARHLVTALRGTDAGDETWTWNPEDQTIGFVARRLCHEVSVHRVDAQLATGSADRVPEAVAIDGIDEMLVLSNARAVATETSGPGTGTSMHLHGTGELAAEWLVTLAEHAMLVEREHAKGDLALRGAPSDLEMALYQRPTVGDVERFGDDAVLDAFHTRFTF